jgi:hypothetical protein
MPRFLASNIYASTGSGDVAYVSAFRREYGFVPLPAAEGGMTVSALRFLTLVLAALGLAPGAAHVLEMPVKLGYTPELYAAVTSTLYAYFGFAGAFFQVGALLSAIVLTYRSRRLQGFWLSLIGAVLLGLSLGVWGAAVAPVNAEWANIINTASEPLPSAYARLRLRWEYGHAAAFAAWFAGFCFLQMSVLREAR